MTVEQKDIIDFVAFDPAEDQALLVMVEAREWGDRGLLLHDLQDKLNTYFDYVTSGRLIKDYPNLCGKKVQIELRTSYPLGPREMDFLAVVEKVDLVPAGIRFRSSLISMQAQ